MLGSQQLGPEGADSVSGSQKGSSFVAPHYSAGQDQAKQSVPCFAGGGTSRERFCSCAFSPAAQVLHKVPRGRELWAQEGLRTVVHRWESSACVGAWVSVQAPWHTPSRAPSPSKQA